MLTFRRSIIGALASAIASTALTGAACAGEVWVTMDYVKPFMLERPAGQIIVGNPGIADVTVQDPRKILLYGKSPGATNLYIFDEDGEKIDNLIVRVRSVGDGMVTFQRGTQRTTLNCMTNCEATVTVGDGESFGLVAGQVAQKVQQTAN